MLKTYARNALKWTCNQDRLSTSILSLEILHSRMFQPVCNTSFLMKNQHRLQAIIQNPNQVEHWLQPSLLSHFLLLSVGFCSSSKNPLKTINKRHPQVVYWPVQRQPSTNHNGIFPCFLVGLHSRFERRIARARQSRRRLSVGSITSSSQPFLAATYGSPNLALYSATNR